MDPGLRGRGSCPFNLFASFRGRGSVAMAVSCAKQKADSTAKRARQAEKRRAAFTTKIENQRSIFCSSILVLNPSVALNHRLHMLRLYPPASSSVQSDSDSSSVVDFDCSEPTSLGKAVDLDLNLPPPAELSD
nr:ethylene-responsive transcription factor 8-like isoform X1 [Ipomoea batatas]